MDIITEAQVEEARLAHAQLVQERERQLAAERRAAREAKEAATHTLVWEKSSNGSDRDAVYTVGDFRIHLQASRGWSKEDRKKARLYVDGYEDVDFTEAYAMQRKNVEAHGSTWYEKGTFPEEDKLFAQLNRTVLKNMRATLAEAVDLSTDLAGVLDGIKLHFSRYAGCSCPCSQGFIASAHIKVSIDGSTFNVTNIWVSKKEVAA